MGVIWRGGVAVAFRQGDGEGEAVPVGELLAVELPQDLDRGVVRWLGVVIPQGFQEGDAGHQDEGADCDDGDAGGDGGDDFECIHGLVV